MTKAKNILLWFLVVSLLGLGILGVWVGMLVREHIEVQGYGMDLLEVVPVEEVWEARGEGEEISLGYMSFWLEPNEIVDVEAKGREVTLILRDGIRLDISVPFESPYPIHVLPVDWAKMTVAEAAAMTEQLFSYEGAVAACYVRPKSHLEYVWMSSWDRMIYRQQTREKKDPYNAKGIVIFEASEIKGIWHRGSMNGAAIRVEIFGQGSAIWQVIVGSRVEGGLEAEQEAKIKGILGSMRYLVETLPGEGELEAMVAEAVGAIVVK